MNRLSGSAVSIAMPSQASTVSPAGTVFAFGFGAGPQTPFGKAAAGRAESCTLLTSNGCASSEVSVTVSVVSSVAEYIGATPRPGAETVVSLRARRAGQLHGPRWGRW